jgi:hypothetical protein
VNRTAASLALALSASLAFAACGGKVVVDRYGGGTSTTAGSCSCSELCSVVDACGESALCNCAAYTGALRACLCGVTPGDCAAERACLGVHGVGGGAGTTTSTTTTGTITGAGGGGQGGAGAGGHAATGTYGAVALYTNVERVVLFEPDAARDICVRVQLAYLAGSPVQSIQVSPDGWTVERIEAEKGADACAACYPVQGVAATDAKGTITLTAPAGGQGMPSAISANLNALFTGGPLWVPPSIDLVTPPVPIGGCSQ